MEKYWKIKEKASSELIDMLSGELNINTFKEAKEFFRPNLDDLHNPFLMKDMDVAVERLQKAIAKKESILIYGDYDVDGTTSVSLVYSFLKKYYDNIDYYIPNTLFAFPDLKSSLVASSASFALSDSIRNKPVR